MNAPLPTLNPVPAVNDCWNRIGVKGDGTCPELKSVVHCYNCPVFAAASQCLFARETPADVLAEYSAELAKSDEPGGGAPMPLLVFRLGEEWLALDVAWVVEVTEPRVVHAIPHRSNRFLLGLVNIRGELQPCVSLRELLGVQAPGDAARAAARFVVAEHEQQRWVFAAEDVAGVQRLDAAALGNVPATVGQSVHRYSRGVFAWDGKRLGYLSAERVFEALKGQIG